MHDARAGQGRIQGMIHHHDAQVARKGHGLLHEPVIRHRGPIIGKSRRAGRPHGGQVSQCAALPAAGDAAGRQHADMPRMVRLLQDTPDHCSGIRGGRGVGHGHHRGEAAARRRQGSGRNGFRRIGAGLAEVHMQIHEAGNHKQAARVNQRRLR